MTEELLVKFGANTTGLAAGVNQAKGLIGGFKAQLGNLMGSGGIGGVTGAMGGLSSMASGLGAALGPIGMGIAAVGTASAAATGMLLNFGESMGDMAEKIDQTSQKLGMAYQQVMQWNAVASMAGISNQALAGSFTKLERTLVQAQQGSKRAAAAFKSMGIDATSAQKPNEMLFQIADKFKTMPDGPRKTAMAMQLMGRAGAQMIPILNQGSEGLREQIQIAKDYGAAFDEAFTNQFIAKGLAVDDQMDKMNLGMQGLKNVLFDSLAPAIESTAASINEFIKGLIHSYETGGTVKKIFDAVAVTFEVLGEIGGAIFSVLSEAVSAFGEVVGAVFDAIDEVFGAVTSNLTGGMSLWRIAINLVITALRGLAIGFQTFGAIVTGVVKAVSAVWMALVNVFKAVWNLDFAGAYAAFGELKTKLGNIAYETGKHVVDNMARGGAGIKDLWSGKKGPAEPRLMQPKGDLTDLPMGGGDDSSKAAKKAAQDRLNIKLAELEREQAAVKDDYDKWHAIEAKKLEEIKKFYGEKSTQYINAAKAMEDAERAHQKKLDQIEVEKAKHKSDLGALVADNNQALLDLELSQEQAALDRRLELEQVTAEEYAALKEALNQKALDQEAAHQEELFDIAMTAKRAEAAALADEPLEQDKVNREIERMEKEHQLRMGLIRAKKGASAETSKNDEALRKTLELKKAATPIADSFSSAFKDILTGAKGFHNAMVGLMDDLVMQWVTKIIQNRMQILAEQLLMSTGIMAIKQKEVVQTGVIEGAKTSAVAVGEGARGSLTAAGAAVSTAATAASATTQVAAHGATAAAGAMAATAPIPFIGPAMAPLVAAGVLAAVMGFMSLISAEGGYDVPGGGGGGLDGRGGQLGIFHPNEMILPAKIANPLRSMIAGPKMSNLGSDAAAAGSSARGSVNNTLSPTFNYSPQITNGGNHSLETTLSKEGASMRRWIGNQIRSGKLKI